MFAPSALVTFILAAVLLVVVPGPAVLYIIARSIDQGAKAGIVSALGIAVGAMGHMIAAILGISAILATSAVAFAAVKYLGAAYLIYLGVSTLWHKPEPISEIKIEVQPLGKIFKQGVVVNLLNPKTALFFLAFLPQFADPARGSISLQLATLSTIFIVIAMASDAVYAFLAGYLGQWLKQNERIQAGQRYFSGVVYILLGVMAAVGGEGKA